MFFTEGVCVALREEQSIKIKIKKTTFVENMFFQAF